VSGSSVYAEFIKEQLEAQDARRESIERRAMSVITTSGVLVSLLFGLAAVVTSAENFVLPRDARPWLGLSLLLFVVAAIMALLANFPLLYRYVKPDALRSVVKDKWSDDVKIAEQRSSATRLTVLDNAQILNSLKGYCLIIALVCEIAAIAVLAWGVKEILNL
jgi:hypothetical protein